MPRGSLAPLRRFRSPRLETVSESEPICLLPVPLLPPIQQNSRPASKLHIEPKFLLGSLIGPSPDPPKKFAEAVAVRDDVNSRPVEGFGLGVVLFVQDIDCSDEREQDSLRHPETILVNEGVPFVCRDLVWRGEVLPLWGRACHD